tara:strand:+ start:1051 stop:1461 length:411 start_codon:yes stop_codon:yes gene_type:complete
MRHQKKGRKLNRTASHRKALMSNLTIALVLNKRIKTTDAKAKELRGFVDRLITYAKKNDVHGRRLIRKKIHGNLSKHISNVLVDEIAPNYSDRNGGYTRIIKLDNRKNDNASVSLVEFVGLSHLVENDESEEESKD